MKQLTRVQHFDGIAQIDFAAWCAPDAITCLLLDIEGTITEWHGSEVSPSVVRALKVARSNGVKHLALISNMPAEGMDRMRAVAAQIEAEAHYRPGNGLKRKPSPSMLHAAMERLGARPEQTAFIGDKLVDVMAARRAGLAKVAWVKRLGTADHPADRLIYRRLEPLLKRFFRNS